MKLKIYGTGCTKCNLLAEHAEQAARSLGVEYDLEKVTDMNDIIDAGVFRTPALAVDDQIIVEGQVPGAEKIRRMLA